MTQEEYWYWFCSTPGMNREELGKLMTKIGLPEELFRSDLGYWEKNGILKPKHRYQMEERRKSGIYLKELEQMEKNGIRFVCPGSEDYPKRLAGIPDYPYGLYVKGRMPDEDLPSVGMVGARACSEYGRKMTFRYGKALAARGVQIISGLAVGVDSTSAKGALAAGGKTFAVLGSGVDVIYPQENTELYYKIIFSGGGIISEYPPGTPPVPWQFPYRNRIISGLSDQLLVMEARKKSGTLITVSYALEQGRDIYALPGRVTDKTSESCNKLIADGAGILLSPEYLLAEIFQEPTEEESGKYPSGSGKTASGPSLEAIRKTLRPDLKNIFDLIGSEPVSADFIIENSRESPAMAGALLSELELLGLIREVSKNNYVSEC